MPRKSPKSKKGSSKKNIWSILLLVFLLLLIPLTVIFLQNQQVLRGRAAQSWSEVGIHPYASVNVSTLGKRIRTLEAWNGKIYAGYGDYNANSGPIHITPYDPVSRTYTDVFTTDTEAIFHYRILGGKLYAPAIDRRSAADYAVGTPEGVWKDNLPVQSTHVYDMNTLDGSDIWMAGSKGVQACVWRSINGGTTWQQMLCENPASNQTDALSRYHFIGSYKGKMYVQRWDNSGGMQRSSKVFDGTTWGDGPNLLPSGNGFRPAVFADKMIYLSYNFGSLNSFYAFDGKNITTLPSTFHYAIEEATNTLYILTSAREIKKTNDLVNWTTVATAPPSAISLAVLNGKFYVGTGDSKIYEYGTSSDSNVSPTGSGGTTTGTSGDVTPPTFTITNPQNGAVFPRRSTVTVSVNAADNVSVARVSFTVAGKTVSDYTVPYSYNLNMGNKPNKIFTVTVTAYDSSNNSSSQIVSFSTDK